MERLRREFTSQWHVIKTNPATYVVVIELFARSIRDAQLRPVARQLLASWEKHLDEHVADGIARGEIAPASGQGPTVTALQCMLLGRALTLLISGGGGSQESLFARVSRWLSPRD